MSATDIDAPQLGEHAWHALADDPRIADESRAHLESIVSAVQSHHPALDLRTARILEIGAYRHFTGHLLSAEHGCTYVASDLSEAALRDGCTLARSAVASAGATLVSCDFHDLPFCDDYFDVAFVAASIHHTRRPEVVLRELLRVLVPGGILIVDNEPCARLCCFHAFASNRAENLTPFEALLRDRGLLPTLSSPFWGTRPEKLFGMVENDRIPLSLYKEAFASGGEVVERTLTLHDLVGPLERELLALTEHGGALQARVRAVLREAVQAAQSAYGETERLLDYGLPTECDIHALADSVATALERRTSFEDEQEWHAAMFGAALRAIVRKRGSGRRSESLFRREMTTDEDGLVRETNAATLGTPLLPDLPTCANAGALAPWFSPGEWAFSVGDNGVRTMANRAARCVVDLAPRETGTLLLVRYHAVVPDAGPFRVRLWAAGAVVGDQLAVVTESRLMRAKLPPQCSEVLFELVRDDDASEDFGWCLRVGVFQQYAMA